MFFVDSREVSATLEKAIHAPASEALRRTGHPLPFLGPLAERRVQWQLVNPVGRRGLVVCKLASLCFRARWGVRSPEEPLQKTGSSTRDGGQGRGQT